MIAIDDIKQLVDGRVQLNEPLARMTSFKIGGPADLFIEPKEPSQILNSIRYLKNHNVRYIILGNGSNILVSDEGYRGAAISLEYGFSNIHKNSNNIITAGAGVRLASFVDFCIENGYSGYEMLAGIPGTLGGAVIMNAGAYGGEISDHILDVDVVRNDSIVTVLKSDCAFGYRTSRLSNDIVIEARFAGVAGDSKSMKEMRRILMLKRNSSQPVRYKNAGSIFKNPPRLFAAKLIEESGLKGFAIGTAEISDRHANFIICKETGSAKDVISLINHIRKVVYEKTYVKLELEIRLVGFTEDVIVTL